MINPLSKAGTKRDNWLTLIDCLAELEKYGNPRLGKLKGGWYCCIEVFVASEGVQFDVKSGFNFRTVEDAANECLTKLKTALDKISKGVK